MMKPGRKAIILLSGTVALILLAIYFTLRRTEQLILDTFADKIITVNQQAPYEISYEGIEISFFTRTFNLTQVLVVPDESFKEEQKAQPHISAESMTAHNFEIFPLILHKNLKIENIEINGLEVAIQSKKAPGSSKKTRKKDGTQLKGIFVKDIELSDYRFIQLNPNLKDTISSLTGDIISLNNIALQNDSGKLQLKLKDLLLHAKKQNFVFNRTKDTLRFDEFHLDLKTGQASVDQLRFGNIEELHKKSLQKRYNTPINAYHIPKIELFGIKSDSLLRNRNFYADSISFQEASVSILKNLNKPWNKDKVIPLPQFSLRRTKSDFGFRKVILKHAQFNYIEVLGSNEITIPIDSLNMTILNLSSRPEYYNDIEKGNLKASVSGQLLSVVDFSSHFTFQNPIHTNDFQFEGSTGPFHFEAFNPVMVPTSNIKFESGRVHQIHFSGQGNEKSAEGEFVMNFKDLKTVVLKKNSNKKKKTFSWLANATVQKENPKNGKLRVAQMRYKRIRYKGFGNYMFKTVESGLINSVYPFGRRKKYERNSD